MSESSKGESPSRIQEIIRSFSDGYLRSGCSLDSENQISELVNSLDFLSDAAMSDPFNEPKVADAYKALSDIRGYISSGSLKQEVVDALSFVLPKAVSKFAGIADTFMDMAISIIDLFMMNSSLNHMLFILCHTLDCSGQEANAASCIVPTLSRLSKVFISMERLKFEQVRFVVATVLNALKAVCLELDKELDNVFKIAVEIAQSIDKYCDQLEKDNTATENLRAILGLYVLQCLALLSASAMYATSRCHSLVQELSKISSHCGLSYLGLVTEYDVEAVASTVFGALKDDYMGCLSNVKHGAALSVVWGHILEIAKEDMVVVKDKLRSNQIKRWQAIGTLQHLLNFAILPWELKEHTMSFMLCITNRDISGNCDEVHSQWSDYMPNLYSALQAIEIDIKYAPDEKFHEKSLSVLKRVLADIPNSERLGILNQLIKDPDSSMIAIWVDIVRREMYTEIMSKVNGAQQMNNNAHPDLSFWKPSALESVDWILRSAQHGGLTSLRDQIDAVLSALNLYRFVLMKESTGKTNYTEVLSLENLKKVQIELLLPLKNIASKSVTDDDRLEVVVKWCLDLVNAEIRLVEAELP